MKRINSVSDYIEAKAVWAEALLLLRDVILGTGTKECMKWSAPAYTSNNENIIGLAAYNDYVGIWFHQGVFLKDKAQLLFNANESKTKGLRQWRFTSVQDVKKNLKLIEVYTQEAIENQKLGKKIKIERKRQLLVPEELSYELSNNKEFNDAFLILTKSKKIEFADYISEAKQAKTKRSRLEKIIPMVIRQEGLNDKYRSN